MSNQTIESLAAHLSIPVSDVTYSLGLSPNTDPKTPVAAKKAAELIKVHSATLNPESDSQKQLAGESKPTKELVKKVATELGVAQTLVNRIQSLNLEATHRDAYNEARLAGSHALVARIGAAEGMRDAATELQAYEDEIEVSNLLKSYKALQAAQVRGWQEREEFTSIVESYKPGSPHDEAILALEQEDARNALIEKIQNGYVPSEEELKDFIVAAAYRLYLASR